MGWGCICAGFPPYPPPVLLAQVSPSWDPGFQVPAAHGEGQVGADRTGGRGGSQASGSGEKQRPVVRLQPSPGGGGRKCE